MVRLVQVALTHEVEGLLRRAFLTGGTMTYTIKTRNALIVGLLAGIWILVGMGVTFTGGSVDAQFMIDWGSAFSGFMIGGWWFITVPLLIGTLLFLLLTIGAYRENPPHDPRILYVFYGLAGLFVSYLVLLFVNVVGA